MATRGVSDGVYVYENRHVPGVTHKWRNQAVPGRPAQNDANICFFFKERSLMKYAKYGTELAKVLRIPNKHMPPNSGKTANLGNKYLTMYWGTETTKRFLSTLHGLWEEEVLGDFYPYGEHFRDLKETPYILLGDMAVWGGGNNTRHVTHKSGKEIDIYYIPKGGGNSLAKCGANWHLWANRVLLHCIFQAGKKTGARYVKTSCEELYTMYLDQEFRSSGASPAKGAAMKLKKEKGDTFHYDHFHVQWI